MEKGYNGWANYETWLFNLYWGDYLHETMKELQESGEKLDYGRVHTIIEGHIDILMEDAPKLDGFLSDILGKGIRMIDTHEIATNIAEELDLSEDDE